MVNIKLSKWMQICLHTAQRFQFSKIQCKPFAFKKNLYQTYSGRTPVRNSLHILDM